jgi:hypothetical protein
MGSTPRVGNVAFRFRCLPGTLTPWAERLTNFVLEFTTMTLNLEVHLPSCLIEDGNYADICVGERRKSILEFWASSPLIRSA